MSSLKTFNDFAIGDCVLFEQGFEAGDFAAFARLSGDHNPLHHDAAYAAASEFGAPIVPLHMTIAPLSRIAGMIFPGDPSLYLGHDLRSIKPVFYGDRLHYSARIIALNPALRILTIRVLGLRGAEVVLDAEMRVQSRVESWEAPEAPNAQPPAAPVALVTGAAGEIGTALAMALAKRGWNLLLADRGPGDKRDALRSRIEPLMVPGAALEHIGADLTDPAAADDLGRALRGRGDIGLVLHCAAPGIHSEIGAHVAVAYGALRAIAEAALPAMLQRQQGAVVMIGSVATERVIPGWEDYSAAKAMAGQYLSGFDKSHGEFGVRGLNVLSGLVATAYSHEAQGDSPAMLPEELAEAVLAAALDEHQGQAVLIEAGTARTGRLGFHDPAARAPAAAPQRAASGGAAEAAGDIAPGADMSAEIARVVRDKLRLSPDIPLEGGGVGATPGWDSLRHIELVLSLEAAFGLHFAAKDVERMMRYDDLVAITSRLLGEG